MQPQALLRRCVPTRGRVVDVGCGDFSRVARYLGNARPDLDFVGLERDVTATSEGALPPPPEARYERLACDLERDAFPFADASFDAAYCSHVIEHVSAKAHLLAEIARVVRPGGLLYLETPGPGSAGAFRPPWRGARFGGTLAFSDDPTHLGRPLDLDDLRVLLEAAGLRVLERGVFRELGLAGMPLYAGMALIGGLPIVPERAATFLYGAGHRNLRGFAIYALAERPALT